MIERKLKVDPYDVVSERVFVSSLNVRNDILAIMDIYHQQEKSEYGVGTPGGLEHMGDVWNLFLKWEKELR